MLYAYLLLRTPPAPPIEVTTALIIFCLFVLILSLIFRKKKETSHTLPNNSPSVVLAHNAWDSFIRAVRAGHLEWVQELMKTNNFGLEISEWEYYHNDPSKQNAKLSRLTPLSIAVANRHYALAKWLLQQGADTTNRDEEGNTPLLRAAINKDKKMVELLLQYKAKDDYNERGQNVMFIATNENNSSPPDKTEWVAWMDWLLQRGFRVDTTNAQGLPLLMAAIHQSQWQAVDYLLQRGADINVKDEHGRTPLLHAIWSGNFSLADTCLQQGADVNICDANDYSPLMYALADGDAGSLRLTQELLRKNTKLHYVNTNNQTALSIALEKQNMQGIKLLVQAGVKLNENTAAVLLRAATTGNKDMVALFLDAGADINTQDDKGWTPLMHAAYGNHADTVELLMQRGADKDIKNKKGKTVVHIIQEAKHFELFDLMRKYI